MTQDLIHMNKKKVIIVGCLGQDGSLMAEKLIKETNYEIYGICRRSSNPNFKNIQGILNNPRFHLKYGDIADEISISSFVQEIKPDYLINCSGYVFVGPSWETPDLVYRINFRGTLNCLEAIRKFAPECRFFSSGSSEEFAGGVETPQTIDTKKIPNNHYGCSKIMAGHLVQLYRKKYNLFAVHGVLYNHESNRRGDNSIFLFPKVCQEAIQIMKKYGRNDTFTPLLVGNLDSIRSWSAAEDIINGIWLMLNNKEPKDYILSSGKVNTVKELIEEVFKCFGLVGKWRNEELWYEQNLICKSVNEFKRDEHQIILNGICSSAEIELDWKRKYDLEALIKEMVQSDLEEANESKYLKEGGFKEYSVMD